MINNNYLFYMFGILFEHEQQNILQNKLKISFSYWC